MFLRQFLGLLAVVEALIAVFVITFLVPSLSMELFDLIRISLAFLFLVISTLALAWVVKDE